MNMAEFNEFFLSTAVRYDTVFVRGKGPYLWDADGRKYLDFFAGISVCNLGHAHPKVCRALRAQAGQVWHVSNYFHHPVQAELAAAIVSRILPGGRVFFSNSGAEANECAIKLARKHGAAGGRYEIVTFSNSFHGRTLATLAATGQAKFHEGIGPMPPGFVHVGFNDETAVRRAVGLKTAAILVEPVQGEGGVVPAEPSFLKTLQMLADEQGIPLIYDEIQTGYGRTGEFIAAQRYRVMPDIVTLAKAIANGVPLGCTVVSPKYAHVFSPGDHGSTFGGNLLACAAGLAVIRELTPELLARVRDTGDYFKARLESLRAAHPCIRTVRGMGLMLGIALDREGKEYVKRCLERGLIINVTQGNVLRFLPPLIIGKKHVDRCIETLDTVLP